MRLVQIAAAVGVACLLPACQANPFAGAPGIGQTVNEPQLEIEAHAVDLRGRDLARYLIARSDVMCEDRLIGLSYQRNSGSTALDLSALALSAASSVTTPVRNANLLSGVSTLFQGSRSKLVDTLFGGNEYPLVYAAVRNGRAARRRAMEERIARGEFDGWAPAATLEEMRTYHLDCGVNYALLEIDTALRERGRAPGR